MHPRYPRRRRGEEEIILEIEGTLTFPTYIEDVAVVSAQHTRLEPLLQVRLVVKTRDDNAAEGWYKVILELVYCICH